MTELAAANGSERTQALLKLTQRLTALIQEETRLFKARRPHEAIELQTEKSELANIYRAEVARARQEPGRFSGASEQAKALLREATKAFHTALDENGQGKPYAVYGYGAQLAEVDVDLALGTVRVARIVAAHDLGRVINPQLAEGQIEGGIAQGLGMALMEEYIPGRTENLHDYLIPTSGDMPEIRSILIEKPDPEGPMGAKGLGEHVLIPTAPAILNAIAHSTGIRLTNVPALPHRLRAELRAKEAGA